MDSNRFSAWAVTRRQFFGRSGIALGTAALASLLRPGSAIASTAAEPRRPHLPPRCKRVIYLFQSGGPSQIDLFDRKPRLRQLHGSDLPASVRMGQRLTGFTAGQGSLPVTASAFSFVQHGRSGLWLSELLPHHGAVADDLCLVRTVHTEAINHEPAITFFQTGAQQPGRPSMGAWVSYGLGSENQDLPAFVVLVSQGSGERNAQPLFARLWGAGFLPSSHQGVKLRGGSEGVLYLSDPPGVGRDNRRAMLDTLALLNRTQQSTDADPEIDTRIAQYEMAFRMQASVPELLDISGEPQHVLEMYGPEVRRPGSYAANCLLARRLAERGVRFVQLYHRGWDQHSSLPTQIRAQARDTDQASAALVLDLKQRGLLDETLVIWGGEFGRTVFCQGKLTMTDYGRDHHPRCFSVWLAGGGVRPGIAFGQTDEFSYNIAADPVHVHDLQATILHLLGIDHERLTFKFQGRHFRLTDVHGAVVPGILA